MKRLALIVLAGVVAASEAFAAQPANCGTAMVEDVEAVTEFVPQTTFTTYREKRRKPGDRGGFAVTTPAERRSKKYLIKVRLNDMLYTAESSGDGFWQFDPRRFVINDPIQACVTKDRLLLRRADGKEYKPRIVRTARESVAPLEDTLTR
jgi:hypothetical protein